MISALAREQTNRLLHHSENTHQPEAPPHQSRFPRQLPLQGKPMRRFYASAKKAAFLKYTLPSISPSHSIIKFRATACAERGDSKGAKPLCPWGSQGDHGSVPLRLFRHLCRYKWRISRDCIAWAVKRTEKELSTYKPITRSQYQSETPPHSSPNGDTFSSRRRRSAAMIYLELHRTYQPVEVRFSQLRHKQICVLLL